MTAQLTPAPIFRSWDNLGLPLVGGKLNTYVAGTTTPQATYTDSTQGTPNTNPVILNFRGEAFVWLDPTLTYKFVLTDAFNNLIWTEDNIPGSAFVNASGTISVSSNLVPSTTNLFTLGSPAFSWANVYLGPSKAPVFDPVSGNVGYYARTAAEIAAGVTPTHFAYAPGKVDRYGTNTTPGTTDMRAAFQAAINQCRAGGADVTWGDTGLYLIGDGTNASSNALDCTFTGSGAQYGLTFRQVGTPGVNLPSSTRAGILVNHSANTVFDLTGTSAFKFYDLTLVTNSSGYPKTCFLTARNSTGESNFPKFNNTTVEGYFSAAILYNYGSEDGVYLSNNWANFATDAGAACVVISTTNLFQGASAFMSSAYTTIATGSQSTIDHQFFGGQYSKQGASTTSDVFYIEGAVQGVKLLAPWVYCGILGGAGGRSIVYNDMTNGSSSVNYFYGVQTEHAGGGANQNKYGILFSNHAQTPTGWRIDGGVWDNQTFFLAAAGSSPTLDNFYITDVSEATSHGISVPGTLQGSEISGVSALTLGTSSRNLLIGFKVNFTITTRTNDIILDTFTGLVDGAQLKLSSGIGLFGKAVAGQITGFGTPTGASVASNFNGASATLPQCSAMIAEILTILLGRGDIGS